MKELKQMFCKAIDSYLNDIGNLKKIMNEIGFAFFENFKSHKDFDNWHNAPLLKGGYALESGLIWKNSINSLMAAKLTENPFYEKIFEIWMSQDLPRIAEFDTRQELIRLKMYLDENL